MKDRHNVINYVKFLSRKRIHLFEQTSVIHYNGVWDIKKVRDEAMVRY